MSKIQVSHKSMRGAPDWHGRGACRGRGELFFSADEFEPADVREKREGLAKALCAVCPVIRECRAHALGAPEMFGVWGGLGEAERERMRPRPRSTQETVLLSEAQLVVLEVAARGGTFAHVGRQCGISRDAARNRIREAARRLGVETREQTVAEAIRLGLINSPVNQKVHQLQEA